MEWAKGKAMDGEVVSGWANRDGTGGATHGYTSFPQQGTVAANNYSWPGRKVARSEAGSTGHSRRTGEPCPRHPLCTQVHRHMQLLKTEM